MSQLSLLAQERRKEDEQVIRKAIADLREEGATPERLRKIIAIHKRHIEDSKKKRWTTFRADQNLVDACELLLAELTK